jgi:hypothetical protein
MDDAHAYWKVLCELRNQLQCWVRLTVSEDGSRWHTPWSQLLITPVVGYLEAWGEPVRLREVEWVEFATKRLRGGIAGIPVERIDITEELLAAFRGTNASWELRDSTWSMERLFADEPVQVIRVLNPYGPTTSGSGST